MGTPPGRSRPPFVDSRIYTDPTIFEEELAQIWRKTWLLTVHESELPEPLDFRTTTIAREPVIIVRGEDGKVRAFLNVCPHRGALLLREPAGQPRQHEPVGRLEEHQLYVPRLAVQRARRVHGHSARESGLPGAPHARRRLAQRIGCEVAYGGFVWLYLDDGPPPLVQHIGAAFDALRPHLEAEPLEIFHHQPSQGDRAYELQAVARDQQRVLPRLHAPP